MWVLRRDGTRTQVVESIVEKTRCARWDSNSGHLHQRQLSNQLRYVTLVTAIFLLKLESVRTSGRIFLVPENGTYRPLPRERLRQNPELERAPILRACADLPETADFRERYFCGAAIQYASYY